MNTFLFTCYSNILIILNFFTFTHVLNTALYLSNWLAFVTNFLLMLTNPQHIAFVVRDVPYVSSLPLYQMHLLNQGYHLIPLYIFRMRQTWAETVSIPSFLIAALLFCCYIVIFPEKFIVDNYGLYKMDLVKLGIYSTAIIFLGSLFVKKIL
jgi:hypothetical protein